jgi:protoporphyrin/coproporphyrin ferrochelatase
MNQPPETGVLLVSHGTVRTLDELPAFLARIRAGREPSPDLVATMRSRYHAIGGSPLATITAEQAAALGRELSWPAFVGTRFGRPSLREALDEAKGIGRLVVLPLAPFSVPLYCRAAGQVARAGDPALVPVEPWGTEPGLVMVHVEHIRSALEDCSDAAVVLTAHSLPAQVVRTGDRYQVEVEACAEAIGRELGRPYVLAYQSGGESGEWLGPTLLEVLGRIRAAGSRTVVVAPIGFLAEHVETLYDLDIEARVEAERLGLGWRRVPAPNTAPGFIRAMAEVAKRALGDGNRC